MLLRFTGFRFREKDRQTVTETDGCEMKRGLVGRREETTRRGRGTEKGRVSRIQVHPVCLKVIQPIIAYSYYGQIKAQF